LGLVYARSEEFQQEEFQQGKIKPRVLERKYHFECDNARYQAANAGNTGQGAILLHQWVSSIRGEVGQRLA
jgi:hypothetical protein